MPELAVGYSVGFFLTAGLVALHLFLQYRKMRRPAMRYVQSNLRKINMFWSDSESAIKDYDVNAEEQDLQKSVRSILIAGVAFTFMSWLGFFLQLMVMLSLRYLAVKRIETRLFGSELAATTLETAVVQATVAKLTMS